MYETVSFATACEDITCIINGRKLPSELKQGINNEKKNQERILVMSEPILFNNIIGILSKDQTT